MADDVQVVDPAATAPDSAPSTPTADPTPAPDPAQPAADSAATPDPVISALEAAMQSGLPQEDPASDTAPQTAPELQQLLSISSYVQSPQHLEQAVRAADEVWQVASGQAPASGLLESMRAANPQGFERVISDLVPYIEQITGKKLGGDATPPDPVQQRLGAIEQQFQQQEQIRQEQIWNQQVDKARSIATDALKGSFKGSFLEGDEQYALTQLATRAGIAEEQMVSMLLEGKTDALVRAAKSFQRDEVARLKRYNERLIANHRKLSSAVPASKGAPLSQSANDGDLPAYLPGETTIQYAMRVKDKF